MSLDTWRSPSISAWMRVSMALRLAAKDVEFVMAAANRNASRHVSARDDGARRGVDRLDPAQKATARHDAAQDRQSERRQAVQPKVC